MSFEVSPTAMSAALDQGSCRVTPAEVVRVSQQHVELLLGVVQVKARVAVVGYHPVVGDSVLTIGSEAEGYYLIGVLSTGQRAQPELVANVEGGCTTLVAEEGDLEIRAPKGAVRIVSGTGVSVTSAGPIDLCSRTAARLFVLSGAKRLLSELRLVGRKASLRAQDLNLAGESAVVEAEKTILKTETARVETGRTEFSAQRMKTTIGVLTSRVQDAYQSVAGLWQLAASRTRMVVKGASHHSAKRVHTKADDVKIKSEKIHLG